MLCISDNIPQNVYSYFPYNHAFKIISNALNTMISTIPLLELFLLQRNFSWCLVTKLPNFLTFEDLTRHYVKILYTHSYW